jgi:hypothetical protein
MISIPDAPFVQSKYADLTVTEIPIGMFDEKSTLKNKNRNYILVQMINLEGSIVFRDLFPWFKRQKLLIPTWPSDCNKVATQCKEIIQDLLPMDRIIIMATCPMFDPEATNAETFVRGVGSKLQNRKNIHKCATPEHFALFLQGSCL